jgi:hypothetical protein
MRTLSVVAERRPYALDHRHERGLPVAGTAARDVQPDLMEFGDFAMERRI